MTWTPHYSNSSTRIILFKNSDWKKQIELKFFWNLSKILLPSFDKIQIWEVNEYKRNYYSIPLFHFDAFNFCLLKFYGQNFVSGINGSKVLGGEFRLQVARVISFASVFCLNFMQTSITSFWNLWKVHKNNNKTSEIISHHLWINVVALF